MILFTSTKLKLAFFRFSIILLSSFATWCSAQTISQAEYFFDTDPGPGNGMPLTFTPGDPVTFTQNINTTGLKNGYHLLYIRTRTSTDIWSLYEPQSFIIDGGIVAAEYFFDVDPGIGNGKPIDISPVTSAINTDIPTASLPDGEHYLYIRTRHDNGNWSLSDPQIFHIQTRIVKAEYFIDTDPGLGNGTPLTIGSPSDLITITPSISTPTLAVGNHYLFVRTKDILGKWSHFEPQLFQVDNALPIELWDFKAIPTKEGKVKLTWITATEINNDFFTVQHSVDGFKFEEIATVRGAGNSTNSITYNRTHDSPIFGTNYYRLKQTDFDGKTSFSKVITVNLLYDTGVSVYPNPTSGDWFIDFTQKNYRDVRLIQLLDMAGKKLNEYPTPDQPVMKLTREGLGNGSYLIRILSNNGLSSVQRISFY